MHLISLLMSSSNDFILECSINIQKSIIIHFLGHWSLIILHIFVYIVNSFGLVTHLRLGTNALVFAHVIVSQYSGCSLIYMYMY